MQGGLYTEQFYARYIPTLLPCRSLISTSRYILMFFLGLVIQYINVDVCMSWLNGLYNNTTTRHTIALHSQIAS